MATQSDSDGKRHDDRDSTRWGTAMKQTRYMTIEIQKIPTNTPVLTNDTFFSACGAPAAVVR